MPTEISNDRLAQIATEAAAKLPELIAEREREILADYHSAVQDAHDDGDDKIPKLKLSLKLEYDMKLSALGVSLGWTVTRKISDLIQLEDPNQMQINLEVVK